MLVGTFKIFKSVPSINSKPHPSHKSLEIAALNFVDVFRTVEIKNLGLPADKIFKWPDNFNILGSDEFVYTGNDDVMLHFFKFVTNGEFKFSDLCFLPSEISCKWRTTCVALLHLLILKDILIQELDQFSNNFKKIAPLANNLNQILSKLSQIDFEMVFD